MNKILLVVKREYLTRVRNKTFILLTFLAPFFYGLLMLMPLLASKIGTESRIVEVVDDSNLFEGRFSGNGNTVFVYSEESIETLQKSIEGKGAPTRFILYIPKDLNIFKPEGITLLSQKNVGAGLKSYLDSLLANRISELRMEALELPRSRIDSLTTSVDVKLQKSTDEGILESSSTATTAAAFVGGFLIYLFVFLYGGFVLRGVQEEKQNRVVEIIISSVRPFQLMMGKIIGIAFVGLTQFIAWVLLTLIITTAIAAFAGDPASAVQAPAGTTIDESSFAVYDALNAFRTLNLPLLLSMFVFYFIGGYLLYSSMFAAVAAAVDSQTDMYQFMFPISIPIVFSITLIPSIIDNPESSLAFWTSIIPFTSPVIMMARIPFDVPVWQIMLSATTLIAGFVFTTWFAAKIYRVGILMYGKKITWRELIKWLFYKG